MPRPENSRVGLIIPLILALLLIAACTSEKPEKPAATPPLAGPTVSLPAVKLEAFVLSLNSLMANS